MDPAPQACAACGEETKRDKSWHEGRLVRTTPPQVRRFRQLDDGTGWIDYESLQKLVGAEE